MELAEEAQPLAVGKVLKLSIWIFKGREESSLQIGISRDKNFWKTFFIREVIFEGLPFIVKVILFSFVDSLVVLISDSKG
jgi:hypothetical protein